MPTPQYSTSDGSFLRASQAKTGEFVTFLDSGEQKEKDINGDKKLIFEIRVSHNGEEKIMSLNKTSYQNLAPVYGMNTDDWVNRPAMITIKDYSDKGFPPGIVLMPCVEPPKQEKAKTVSPESAWDE